MSKQGVTAVLQVEGLHKAFGGVQAVADVSFAVDAGELLALIGPNGAGKSTCFNMLNGQLAPDAGIVRLGGRDIVGLRPRAVWRLGVGRTFQITATFASLSVRENVQKMQNAAFSQIVSARPVAWNVGGVRGMSAATLGARVARYCRMMLDSTSTVPSSATSVGAFSSGLIFENSSM